MLENKSPEFIEYFLMSFTKEILKNSMQGNMAPPKRTNLIQKNIPKPMEKSQFQKSHISPIKDNNPFSNFARKFTKELPKPPQKIFAKKIKTPPGGKISIPEPRLPAHLQYLRPTPEEASIELGGIDPLIKDPAVKVIECGGPDERVLVKGAMGVKPTTIALREDEINSIIEEFAKKSKIPIHDGVYRVVVGRLVFSAIISTVIPPKFIIEKMRYPQQIKRGFLRNAR